MIADTLALALSLSFFLSLSLYLPIRLITIFNPPQLPKLIESPHARKYTPAE